MQVKNIKTVSFGCRLNSMEVEKISDFLSPLVPCAVLVNTCAVTREAQRQSAQAVRKLARENENTPIYVTGCAATLDPTPFEKIPNTYVVDNFSKMDKKAYPIPKPLKTIENFGATNPQMSKKFIQIQNGCNHECTYCITRILRGKNKSFPYADILSEVQKAIADGFSEIVLTGVDIAGYIEPNNTTFITDLCKNLLRDVPKIQRLRLSSMDPASPEIPKLIELMKTEPRMMPHLHLSMQAGSDPILARMARRHTTDIVHKFVLPNPQISFSWDIICGFPGETDELFKETADLVRKLRPIKAHAFPYSIRPGTPAATMPNQVDKSESKRRVKEIIEIADANKLALMKTKLGTVTQVLMEENNIARTPDDIEVVIEGDAIPARTVLNVELKSISDLHFVAKIC